MESPQKQIEFFEEEVKEILGKPPQYLLRWGISLYLLLFTLVVFLSAIINYPTYSRFDAVIIPQHNCQNITIDAYDKIKSIEISDGMTIGSNKNILSTESGVLKSEIEGRIKFLKPIHLGYSSLDRDTVIQINPISQDYNLSIAIPKTYINQIKIDQKISFRIDSKIIDGKITAIPSMVSSDGYYHLQAKSESRETFLRDQEDISVDVLIDNKKIFHKILNL